MLEHFTRIQLLNFLFWKILLTTITKNALDKLHIGCLKSLDTSIFYLFLF